MTRKPYQRDLKLRPIEKSQSENESSLESEIGSAEKGAVSKSNSENCQEESSRVREFQNEVTQPGRSNRQETLCELPHQIRSLQSFSFPMDPSRFVKVIRGDLPLVLSAPHGGREKPHWIPNLTTRCHVSDAHTFELTQQLAECFSFKFHRTPFCVLNRLHRKKMDANRDVNTASEGEPSASFVYDAYHEALKSCCESARACSASGEALLLDIHGHASLPNVTTLNECWVMVGHLVPSHVLSDHAALEDEEWIRGPTSMGSLMEKNGLLAEPSARRKVPSQGKYLHGGHITETYREKGKIRTIQLEFPRPMRDNLDHVVPKVADALMDLLHSWNMIANNNKKERHY